MTSQPSQVADSTHDRLAPYWAAGLVLLCTTGLATVWIDGGAFWKGYVLDMAGPAWTYILIRGLYTAEADNAWTRFFTPTKTVVICIAVCFGIETAQFLHLYDATFDPWDFVAYVSLLVPAFLLDVSFSKKKQY